MTPPGVIPHLLGKRIIMNKRSIYPLWFVLIPLFFYVVFFLMPSILGVFYSFTDWNVRNKGEISFVGLQNYIEIFTSDKGYGSGIINTLKFTVVSNVVKLIPALFLAILLQFGLRGQNLYRTILYMPAILPFLIIGLIFKAVFNYEDGILNVGLGALHLEFLQQKWLSDLQVVWKSIYLVDAWRGLGYVMTIFLAGLSAIPHSYYEAAEIDGARFFHKLWYITLPMLSGSIMINLVFGITYGLKVFDIVYVLTNGGPGHATEVVTTYAYKLYATGLYGLSVAMSTILFIVSTIAGILIVVRMSRKEVQH